MFLLKLLSRLPFTVLYLISDFLFFVSFHIVRYRRRLVQGHLKKSFPNKSSNDLKQIERTFYKRLCDYAVETLKLMTISKEELMQRMRFENMELLESFPKNNQSIIFLASHQFNWEWMLVSASASFPMQIDFVYQPVNSTLFNKFALQLRTRFNAYGIQRNDVARELVKRKSILRGIAIVADQYPGHGVDKKFPATFLNQDTVFFLGANNIAVLSQYPVLYYSIRKVQRGHYIATPEVLAIPPFEKGSTKVIESYINAVEESIKADPANWLWSHNRWKTRHLNQR